MKTSCRLGGIARLMLLLAGVSLEQRCVGDSSVPTRYVLLDNDRVVAGEVQTLGEQTIIRRQSGALTYATKQIVVVGDNLEDLYQHKVKSVPWHDAGEHLKISRWCMQNKLRDLERIELEQVLKIDPSSEEATRRLKAMIKQDAPPRPKDLTAEGNRQPVHFDHVKYMHRMQAGMGNELFEKFTGGVESLLLNRCAICHASLHHTSNFKLHWRGAGIPTGNSLTAKNLNAIMQMIEIEDPNRSPLLYMALRAHGPQQVPSFGGVNDTKYAQVRDWVFGVARRQLMSESNGPTLAGKVDDRPLVPGAPNGRVGRSKADKSAVGMDRTGVTSLPGDEPPKAGMIAADDAPEPAPSRSRMIPRSPEPTPAPTTEAKSERPPAPPRTPPPKPPASGDPNDPAEFNQQTSAPKADAEKKGKP